MQTLSETKVQSWLVWFLRGLLILGFLVLFGRLVDLQVVRGNYFRSLAEENRIRRVPITAERGKIYARGGETLVDNTKTIRGIVFNDSGFEKTDELEGISKEEQITEWDRIYPLGEAFAHITGYLGEVTEEELGKIAGECPQKGARKLGALAGRGGLEEFYDCILKGIDGEELVEVDALGRRVRTLGRKSPISGEDIRTNLDYSLQNKVYDLMKDKKGAVLVSDIKGQVLALYSSPSFDPNIFLERDDVLINSVLKDLDKPLFNRVIGGIYHPGSIYKPVVAIASLEEDKIDKEYSYQDTGQITIDSPYGSFSYKNWYFTQYGGVEGEIGVERAIARSTDTFFYKLGELVGVDNLVIWSDKFGLGSPTGIDLPGEVSGLIPSPEWKVKVKGERWFLGNTYHMSIGQGDLALTPAAINQAISAIANDGKNCTPHIISMGGKSNCKDLEIKKKNIDIVKDGMAGACSAGGTGYTFFDFEEKSGLKVGCKTGTAEVEDKKDPHAWFTVFAPIEDPEIVATVLVENGGEGSKVAGPIAREIFNHWFNVQTIPTPTSVIVP